jgi:hypothetical protein
MSDICQQSPIDIDYPESDWEHLHQTDFTFDAAEATREEDLQRLQHYRETGHGIPHEQVAAWLSSIGRSQIMTFPGDRV